MSWAPDLYAWWRPGHCTLRQKGIMMCWARPLMSRQCPGINRTAHCLRRRSLLNPFEGLAAARQTMEAQLPGKLSQTMSSSGEALLAASGASRPIQDALAAAQKLLVRRQALAPKPKRGGPEGLRCAPCIGFPASLDTKHSTLFCLFMGPLRPLFAHCVGCGGTKDLPGRACSAAGRVGCDEMHGSHLEGGVCGLQASSGDAAVLEQLRAGSGAAAGAANLCCRCRSASCRCRCTGRLQREQGQCCSRRGSARPCQPARGACTRHHAAAPAAPWGPCAPIPCHA